MYIYINCLPIHIYSRIHVIVFNECLKCSIVEMLGFVIECAHIYTYPHCRLQQHSLRLFGKMSPLSLIAIISAQELNNLWRKKTCCSRKQFSKSNNYIFPQSQHFRHNSGYNSNTCIYNKLTRLPNVNMAKKFECKHRKIFFLAIASNIWIFNICLTTDTYPYIFLLGFSHKKDSKSTQSRFKSRLHVHNKYINCQFQNLRFSWFFLSFKIPVSI